MKIYTEKSLHSFNFWAGAVERVKYLSLRNLKTIEAILDELYPDGLSETEINDLFWFEEELIAEWLGFDCFDDIVPPFDIGEE
jgi:hypothetical protein